jgi:hypothetical protein
MKQRRCYSDSVFVFGPVTFAKHFRFLVYFYIYLFYTNQQNVQLVFSIVVNVDGFAWIS